MIEGNISPLVIEVKKAETMLINRCNPGALIASNSGKS